MAAAVLQPLQGLSLDGGIMPPSPISQNSSRHGRSRHGGSVVKGNKTRGRGYSIVDDREVMISKALTWVLKRTVEEGEEQEEDENKLVADSNGWVDCEELLQQPNLSALQVTFPELQSLISSPASKSRFSLKLNPSTQEDDEEEEAPSSDPSDYLIRANPTPTTTQRPASPTEAKLTPIFSTTTDIPDLIVYETSYANYPLILASGGIKRAGGQAHLSFTPLTGTEIRPNTDADVCIYISLPSILSSTPSIIWQRTETGNVVTEGDANGVIEKRFWKKVVARRADIGVLYEDGLVKKEVPVGLRGKGGGKGKRGGGKGKGRGLKELKGRSDDEGTASD